MTGFPCPVECGDGPFSTENGAVMHAVNKSGGDHDSVTDKPSAYQLLNQVTADESGQDPPEIGDGGGESTETGDDDPAKAGPEPDDSVAGEIEEPTCPDCESSRYALTKDYPDDVPDEFRERYEYLCADCGEVFNFD